MNEFEIEAYRKLRKLGFVYRLPDSTIYPQSTRKMKPICDFLFLRDGNVYFIECKSTVNGKFLLKNITKNQWDMGKKINENGGKYVFLIKMKAEVFAVPYNVMLNMTKKSVNTEDLHDYSVDFVGLQTFS